MSTTGAVALTLLVLTATGALPVLLLVGPRLVAPALMPLAGAVVCAVSAVCSIALFGSTVQWFIAWAVTVTVASGLVLLCRPERGRALGRALRRGPPPLVALGSILVLAAVVSVLRTLRVPNVGFDARSIWILHARWLTHGHAFALADIRSRLLIVSHSGYPPLTSSVMALAWRVSGTSSDRVAVVMVALLNACALFVAGWGIVEAARRVSLRLLVSRRRQQLLIGLGIVTAVLTVLLAGGVLGTFATNGYADPLWSLTAVGVVLYGLVLPPTVSDLAVAAILIAVAGLTKVEGTAVAMILVVVITVRLATRGRRLRPLLAVSAAAGLVALLVWPLLTFVIGVPTDPSLTGSRQGSLASRAHRTLSAMAPHLHVVLLAAICGVLGLFLLRALRGRLGLGNDLWSWAALVGAGVVLGGAYVFGPGNVELWLDTSVNRTTIFVALLGWWMVAVWAICGAAGAALYGGGGPA